MSLVLGAELLPLQAPFAYAEVMTDAGDCLGGSGGDRG